jgi:hypothetical protein
LFFRRRFSGVNCEVDVSVCNATDGDRKCLHGGRCIDGLGPRFTCDCAQGESVQMILIPDCVDAV